MKITKYFKILLLLFALLITTGCGSDSKNDSNTPDSQQVKEVKIKEKKNFKFTQKVPNEGFKERYNQFILELVQYNHKRGKSFMISAIPMDSGMILLSNLEDYCTKRYEDPKIRSEFLLAKAPLGDRIIFLITLDHLGGYDNEDKIPLDELTYEFFFLENENGDYVRASGQELDMFTDEVSWLNESVQIIILFPQEKIDELMVNANELYLTFEGLGILDENKIKLKYPFNQYYNEEFPEIDVMIEEMEK